MESNVTSILTLLEGSKQFVIPIYQRTYSWQKEQCQRLWDDVVQMDESSDDIPHFFGSIVNMKPETPMNNGDVSKYVVIDGQQRLTTLSLLLSALCRIIEAQGLDIGISPTELSNFYFNNSKEGDARYKQILTKSDKETLMCILDDIQLPEFYSQNLVKNYQFFLSQVKKVDPIIVYIGIQRLQIVNIILGDQDKPQLIFEGLNAKGLSLTEADKIRNYVLMGQKLDFQTYLYKRLWFPIEQRFRNQDDKQFDRFMRHYLTLKTRRIPALRDIYKYFRLYVPEKDRSEKVEETLKEISDYSQYYLDIAVPKEKDKELQECLVDLKELNADTAYPFLLTVYDYYRKKIIEKSDVIKTLQLVESYIFRRAVCGLSLKFLNHTFVEILETVKNNNEDRYLEKLNDAFLSLRDKRYYPRDNEFKEFFISIDTYHFSKRNYMFRKLENFKRKEPVDIDNYTIEHVMPQTLTDDWKKELGNNYQMVHELWLHKIGNLTLTGYNSELSNHPFKEKRDSHQEGFRFSPLYLNYSLASAEGWNEKTMFRRGKDLADRAAEIWIYPES